MICLQSDPQDATQEQSSQAHRDTPVPSPPLFHRHLRRGELLHHLPATGRRERDGGLLPVAESNSQGRGSH